MKDIFTLICTAILMSSCLNDNHQTTYPNDMRPDSIVADTTITFDGKTYSQPYCRIYMNVKYLKGYNTKKINNTIINSNIFAADYMPLKQGSENIKQIVHFFIKKYISDYKEFYDCMYLNDKEHADSYNNIYKLNTNIEINKKGILTYITTISINNGKAHATNQTLVRNINIDTGEIISLSDIFKHGYNKTVKEIIITKLSERFNTENLAGLIKKSVFVDGNVYIPDNFIIEKNKITFIYCESEIASHEAGEIRINIYNDEVKNLLKLN